MSVLWSVALSSATKNCKAAVTAHQDFFHANQEWSCNCNQDGSLTRCVDEWLQLLVSCLQYAEPELDKLLTTEMSAWKLQLLLEQMGYADQQDDIPAYSFEDAYNDMAEVSANALELATAVQALLQRELPCMNCDWKTEALNKCQHILQRIDGQIKKQLSKALVVMEQPPNIIRQGKNFNTSVRLLSCGPLLESANYMVAVRVDSFENAGKICNSENKLENNTAQLAAEKNNSKEFNARFSKMKITTIKERSKKNDKQYGIENRSKTDEAEVKKILKKPFVLQYVVNGVLYGGIESIKIQTISELFFYITHGSQKSFATALAFWKSIPLLEAAHGDTKAYYTSSTYFDFNIDFHVSWPFFENALCIFFTKTVGPKKGFHPDQLQNIKNKLFGQKSAPENASFSILAEQNLLNAGRTTFWEWFYEAVLLIKTDPILNIWNNGWFYGFISRSEAEKILRRSTISSFIIRLSDSRLGTMSLVTWKPQQKKIAHLDPFNAYYLLKKPLKTIECQEMQSIEYLITLDGKNITKLNVLDALKKKIKVQKQPCSKGYANRTPADNPIQQQLSHVVQDNQLMTYINSQPIDGHQHHKRLRHSSSHEHTWSDDCYMMATSPERPLQTPVNATLTHEMLPVGYGGMNN